MKILVLCTGNSCRSQMAEGWLRKFLTDQDEIFSAGLETHGVNLNAIKAMAEAGVDISGHTSNNLTEYIDQQFDYVITVCDNAAKNCPIFQGQTEIIHWPFDDPAGATGSPEEIASEFRRVRDEIRAAVETWIAGIS